MLPENCQSSSMILFKLQDKKLIHGNLLRVCMLTMKDKKQKLGNTPHPDTLDSFVQELRLSVAMTPLPLNSSNYQKYFCFLFLSFMFCSSRCLTSSGRNPSTSRKNNSSPKMEVKTSQWPLSALHSSESTGREGINEISGVIHFDYCQIKNIAEWSLKQ